jgi:hypothetical protein
MTDDEREPGDRIRSWIAFIAFTIGIAGVIGAAVALKIAAGDSVFAEVPVIPIETACTIETAALP